MAFCDYFGAYVVRKEKLLLAFVVVLTYFSTVSVAIAKTNPLQWLKSADYAQLDRYYSDLQKGYESGKVSEEELYLKFRGLYSNSNEYDQHFNQWVETYPKSYVAHLARGTHFSRMAISARGSEWFDKVSPEQAKKMNQYFSLALPDLEKSQSMTVKPYLTILHLMNSAWHIGDIKTRRKLLELGNQIDPKNWYVRYRYMLALKPRWGGTYELMQAFLQECKVQGLAEEKLLILESAMYADMLETTENLQKKAHLLEKMQAVVSRVNAKSWELPYDSWRSYARANMKLKKYDQALIGLQMLAKEKSNEAWVYSQMGWIHLQEKNMADSWANLTKAANMNDAWSQFAVGKTYYEGCDDINLAADKTTGVMWIKKSAAQGFQEAQAFLAQ